MGVDFYSCTYCGETFPDCGEFVRCDCGEHWCSEECAAKDGFRFDDEDNYDSERSCKFCRHEDVKDEILLNFMLKHFRVTREQMVTTLKGTTFSEEV